MHWHCREAIGPDVRCDCCSGSVGMRLSQPRGGGHGKRWAAAAVNRSSCLVVPLEVSHLTAIFVASSPRILGLLRGAGYGTGFSVQSARDWDRRGTPSGVAGFSRRSPGGRKRSVRCRDMMSRGTTPNGDGGAEALNFLFSRPFRTDVWMRFTWKYDPYPSSIQKILRV